MRSRSRLQVSSSRGTRIPLISPVPAPSWRSIHFNAPANSRRPFSSLTVRFNAGLVGTQVAHVAVDARAFLRHADLEKRLAEVISAAFISDQPMRCAVT